MYAKDVIAIKTYFILMSDGITIQLHTNYDKSDTFLHLFMNIDYHYRKLIKHFLPHWIISSSFIHVFILITRKLQSIHYIYLKNTIFDIMKDYSFKNSLCNDLN